MPSFKEIIKEAAKEIYERYNYLPYPSKEIYDFDEQKDRIEGRAHSLALEVYSRLCEDMEKFLEVVTNSGYPGIDDLAREAFYVEKKWYPTNKPNAQELRYSPTNR